MFFTEYSYIDRYILNALQYFSLLVCYSENSFQKANIMVHDDRSVNEKYYLNGNKNFLLLCRSDSAIHRSGSQQCDVETLNWNLPKVIQWNTKWEEIVFSDEIKMSLDRPGSFACYYHDIRKEDVHMTKINFGEGSVNSLLCSPKSDFCYVP